MKVQLDPRSVANLVLDAAEAQGITLTNLALQKILYFIHGRFLVEEGRPLIAGSFEAWQYGPVSLPVYEAFRRHGSSAISTRATKKDFFSGQISIVPVPDNEAFRQRLTSLAEPFFRMSPGRLVELSHAKNSPWDVATATETGRSFGLRISNESIKENFKNHKISIREVPRVGEPDEESAPY